MLKNTESIDEIIRTIIASKPWSAEEVVEAFAQKIGLCGDNGYESIYFPENQDEYGVEVEGWAQIGLGMVELTYWDGEEKSIYLSEVAYKEHLLRYLAAEKISLPTIDRLRNIQVENR